MTRDVKTYSSTWAKGVWREQKVTKTDCLSQVTVLHRSTLSVWILQNCLNIAMSLAEAQSVLILFSGIVFLYMEIMSESPVTLLKQCAQWTHCIIQRISVRIKFFQVFLMDNWFNPCVPSLQIWKTNCNSFARISSKHIPQHERNGKMKKWFIYSTTSTLASRR